MERTEEESNLVRFFYLILYCFQSCLTAWLTGSCWWFSEFNLLMPGGITGFYTTQPVSSICGDVELDEFFLNPINV